MPAASVVVTATFTAAVLGLGGVVFGLLLSQHDSAFESGEMLVLMHTREFVTFGSRPRTREAS